MLHQKLQEDQTGALKSGDKRKLEVLRYVNSQIKNKEIEKKELLSDEEVMAVLQKTAKQLKESIDAFEKGGRTDLVEEHEKQLAVLETYLPAELTDEELAKEIDRIIADNQGVAAQNPKALIGITMKELRTKAYPARIMKLLNGRA